MKEKILERIKNRQSVVGIVGLGYVGLPIAIDKAKAGYMVIGFDVNADKVKMINNSKSYIQDIDNSEIAEVVENNMLIATDDFSQLKKVDIIEICVPTPLDKFKQPDLSYVKLTCETISKNLINGQIIVMKSTTYPGTTVELIKPILEKSNLQCGKDFFLGFSPERIDPGNKKYKSKDMPQIVGGFDDNSREIISQFYGEIYSIVFEVSSPSVAEMSKLLENTFRNVNISLVNEMAILCNKMNISIWEVIESAKTKPFGFMPFYPGSGAGGHCIPLDPCYLEWKAKEFDFHTTLIECSSNINDKMSDYCLSRISKILNNNCKSIKNSSILFLGVAYKQDIGDC
ncbi:MAG: nucleotide sugar dehydrogenase, partial [Oscillospiraceae bacterium]